MQGTPGTTGYLASTLPVATLAAESVGALGTAVAQLQSALGPVSTDGETVTPTASMARIAASFMGDTLLRIDGESVQAFADLSGFFPVSDGWVRTHANYPHHRMALLDVVGLGGAGSAESIDIDVFGDRLRGMSGFELEELCAASGALAVRVRTEEQWSAHPAGIAASSGPVVTRGAADPVARVHIPSFRPLRSCGPRGADHPLAGIRVLDLTRVIAGPVATRALALLGADVLRVDSPRHPELPWQHLENGQGKRSALLDLDTAEGLDRVLGLLDSADVLVTGYRPGALDRFGLEHRTDLVHGCISAWGTEGPWSRRRGFDSLVQAASGISVLEGRDGRPGRLPAQALDHASGYLLAAGIISELAARAEGSGTAAPVDVALARTAAWLTDLSGRDPEHGPAAPPPLECVVTHGSVTAARPVFDCYSDYAYPAHVWGSDDAG
ncbi:CoA transferase [Rhodococcus sp. IEGM 1354]|uniref:CoA transferase n=1 Tax=Rhodococcus sp. IEGM 1354 TaxID=3047088 RepID=UPI0024B6A51D|nr:CoA transferase [Rhodococcus sp. IEGM 1354]MDI9930953.1 CoA transferase [Rhodococcus sp. IEGM 1354]